MSEANGNILKPPPKITITFEWSTQTINVECAGITNMDFAKCLAEMAVRTIDDTMAQMKAQKAQQATLSPAEKAALERTLRR